MLSSAAAGASATTCLWLRGSGASGPELAPGEPRHGLATTLRSEPLWSSAWARPMPAVIHFGYGPRPQARGCA
eukprot:10498229-Alexandrium_andersonii.AAC.1